MSKIPRYKELLWTDYWGKGLDNDKLIEAIEEYAGKYKVNENGNV